MAKVAREVPRVRVISRHRAECPSKSEGKAYVRCSCPKALYWYEGGKERVVSADTEDYQEAERRAFQKQASFEAVAAGEPEHTTITEAINLHLQSKRASGIKDNCLEKAALPLRAMEMYLSQKGVIYLRDVKSIDLEQWRNTWEGAPVTRAKRQGRVKGFFQWCLNKDLIQKNPALGLEHIKGGTDCAPTIALDDAQFNAVLAGIDKLKPWDKNDLPRFRAFTLLQRWSGLAFQDALMIERSRFRKMSNGWYRLFLRRAKTGTDVYVSLAPEVAEQILSINPVSERYLFWDGKESIDRLRKQHGDRLRSLSKLIDLKTESGEKLYVRSHMFRDSFAVWCFLQGMAVEDVAMLLGHQDIRVTQKHYSPFIRARAERLGSIVESAYTAWSTATSSNVLAWPVTTSEQVAARVN